MKNEGLFLCECTLPRISPVINHTIVSVFVVCLECTVYSLIFRHSIFSSYTKITSKCTLLHDEV